MNLYLYLDAVTNLYIFKHKGFVFNPKSGSLMLIERESDGFVNLQALYDNKAFRQNTNGQILSEFIDPSTIVNELGISYGNDAQAIRTALADFFVDAPSGGGGLSVEQVKSQSTTKAPSSKLFADVTGELELNIKTSIASLENVINSANINQETTATVTGVDTVLLPKTAANTGMQVQLFGQSAENLVVNGDFRNGTTGWTATDTGAVLSASNNILTHTVAATQYEGIGVIRATTFLANNKYYLSADIKTNNNSSGTFFYGLDSTAAGYAINIAGVNDSFVKLSGVLTAPIDRSNVSLGQRSARVGVILQYKNVMAINLTALGLDSLTKEQCDILFANYFEGSDNVLGTGRVRSVGKNLIDVDKIESNIGLQVEKIQNGIRLSGVYNTKPLPIKIDAGTTIICNYTAVQINGTMQDVWAIYYEDGTVTYHTKNNPVTLSKNMVAFSLLVELSGVNAVGDFTNIQLEIGSTATSYEPYRQSILQLTTPELRSNGLIKDEIRKGTNGYELVKRVGVGTLGAELITNAADREFTSDTGFWTLNPAYCEITGGNLVFTNTANGNGLVKVGFLTIGKRYKITLTDVVVTKGYISFGGSLPEAPLIASSTAIIERTSIAASGTTFFLIGYDNLTCSIGGISIKELDEADGTSIGDNVLTEFGSNAHYTLATPVITPISHAGLLNSNSNGTTYFEPIIADAGVYSSNLAIQLTDYPIASFESIRKYANGTYTELDITLAQKAGDGLSFTHSGLNPGDLVMFTYAYNRESIGRNMTLSYAISNSNPYYNITNSVPLTTGYYTSTTARAAVPEGIRKTGLILTYETAAGVWYTERYIGTATDTTSWTTAGNWEIGVLRIAAVTDTTEYAEITI